MNRTLFVQGQYNRKREYVVMTELALDGKQKKIIKKAIYPEGGDHIRNIFENYQLLSTSEYKFELPKTEIKDDALVIEYIDGPNMESEIETLLFEGKIEEANQLVEELIEFLHTFPIVKANPYDSSEFVKTFDPKKKYLPKKNIDCWQPGFHDINFDNFVRKNGKYYFVDFEWCFEYPLPKDFLILRAVFYLGLKLNRTIQSKASKEFPCLNFFDNLYIPLAWMDLVFHSSQELQKLLDYEYNLLSKILTNYTALSKIKKGYASNKITNPVEKLYKGRKFYETRILELQQHINNLNSTTDNLSRDLSKKDKKISKLNNSLRAKDNIIDSHYSHIEELRAVNRKYAARSYRLVERIENTRIAKFRPLRIALRETLALVSRIYKYIQKLGSARGASEQ